MNGVNKITGRLQTKDTEELSVKINNQWYDYDKYSNILSEGGAENIIKQLNEDDLIQLNNVNSKGYFAGIEKLDNGIEKVEEEKFSELKGKEVDQGVDREQEDTRRSEDELERMKERGKLYLDLVYYLVDEYRNKTSRPSLNEAEYELINSVVKRVLWDDKRKF